MKKIAVLLLSILAALAFPTFAFADVAGVGTLIVFGLLPYVLIAAVILTVVIVLVKCIRRKKKSTESTNAGEEQ